MHRWVDAAGVTHYSDRPPPEPDATSHTQRRIANDQPVTVTIETVDASIPPYTKSRARTYRKIERATEAVVEEALDAVRSILE